MWVHRGRAVFFPLRPHLDSHCSVVFLKLSRTPPPFPSEPTLCTDPYASTHRFLSPYPLLALINAKLIWHIQGHKVLLQLSVGAFLFSLAWVILNPLSRFCHLAHSLSLLAAVGTQQHPCSQHPSPQDTLPQVRPFAFNSDQEQLLGNRVQSFLKIQVHTNWITHTWILADLSKNS